MRINACVIALAFLVACNGEKHRLQERLAGLEQEQATLSQRLEKRRNTVRDTLQQIETLNSELTTYNTEMQSFVAAHRVAVECIRASRSTWGENDALSHDASTATKFGTALCSVALLNRTFAQEVAGVGDRLNGAGAHTRSLKDQIAALERTLEAERSEMRTSEAEAGQNTAEIADVRRQLER